MYIMVYAKMRKKKKRKIESTYEHEKRRRVANPAKRVTKKISEERQFSTGSNFTPSLQLHHFFAVFFNIILSNYQF